MNNQKFQNILNRGVAEIIGRAELEKKLNSGQKLRVKLGIDPTSPNLHIGRSVPLLKLRDFQELGHQVVFIIGDFTGVIGDTSDKESERPMLDSETVKKNMETYVQQAGKILDLSKCEIHSNSQWLDKLRYQEICLHANIFSVNEFIARENIKKRLDAGKRVSLREMLYPLMQGYDSVAIKADVELGGTDQRFNILAGREMQRALNQEPQSIITNPLIEGLDGRKMSSSWGNTINLLDSAREMYGKIMSLKDEFIIRYFEVVTRVNLNTIAEMKETLKNETNPRDLKMRLAREIVTMYHDQQIATEEENYFIETFSKKTLPQDIKIFKPQNYQLINILTESGLASSKTEARRLIEQKGVKVNQEIVSDQNLILKSGDILQKGKINFLKIE